MEQELRGRPPGLALFPLGGLDGGAYEERVEVCETFVGYWYAKDHEGIQRRSAETSVSEHQRPPNEGLTPSDDTDTN